VTVTPQLKAIVLAGGLAALALVLGFLTLSMNQPSSSAADPKPILPLHARMLPKARTASAAAVAAKAKAAKAKPKPAKPAPNPNVVAALKEGLPQVVAAQLADHSVVVVELYSGSDQVDDLARGEAASGAALAGAGFAAVNVDRDGPSAALTKLLGTLPPAPAALVYQRPAKLFVTLPGFNDRTTIQQAATNADPQPRAAVTDVASAAWVAQVNALCTRTIAEANALGGTKADASLLAKKPRFDAIMQRFFAQVRAVKGAPAQAKELNALLAQNVALTDTVLTAIAKKDLVGLGAATSKHATVSNRLHELERQLGLTGCAGA
jgi:hypothetical protein